MTSFVEQVIAFVAGNSPLTYALIFVMTISEAFPVIGAFIPGSLALVALSALIPTGALSLWPTLIAATAGAVVGDGLPYWVGHRYRERILRVWPFSQSPQLVTGSTALFRSHGIKSVVVARFTPARAIVPIAAGIAGMPVRRFYVANVLSAMIYAPAHVLPGAALGATVSLLGAVAGRLALLVAIIVGSCWLLLLAARWSAQSLAPLLPSVQVALWRSSQRWNIRLPRVLLAWLDPTHPVPQLVLPLAVLVAAGAWIGATVLVDAAIADPDTSGAIGNLFQGLRSSWGDALMGDLSLVLGSATVVVGMTVLAWSAVYRACGVLGWWLACLGAAVIAALLTGPAILFDCPIVVLSVLGQGCGPVGLVLGSFAVLCARSLQRRGASLVALATMLAVALSSLVGLYFGATASTVLTGLTLALLGVGLLGLRHAARPAILPHGRLTFAATPVLAAVLSGALAVFGPDYVGPVRLAPFLRLVDAQAWWDKDWARLPPRRIDLDDDAGEPLTVQWAGSAQDLSGTLASAGWREPPAWTWRSSLAWVADPAAPDSLPILPRLHRGLPPVLTLTRLDNDCPVGSCIVVLRLWRSATALTTSDRAIRPVLVGTVVRLELQRVTGLFTLARAQTDVTAPCKMVADALGTGRIVDRPGNLGTSGWDGRVLIAPTFDAGRPRNGEQAGTTGSLVNSNIFRSPASGPDR